MAKDSEIVLRVTADRRLVEEWELVLLAQGLSPSVIRNRNEFMLAVPEDEIEQARAGLAAYENENPPKVQEGGEPVGMISLLAGMAIAGMVLGFFFVTVVLIPTVPWLERGSADAERILRGEVWRTVTALGLHADLVHALANAIALAVFLAMASSMLGPGLGFALVLLAGAGGNLANAFLYGSPHVAIGASTSVFGAVGLLGGFAVRRRQASGAPKRRVWIPIAAILALLGMMGGEGQRVDIWAHLFGLLFGAVLGNLSSVAIQRTPDRRVQWACGGATGALLIYCWTLALH